MTGAHPLLAYLVAAAGGRFPKVDGACTVVPALPSGLECSVAFTGHAVVATALTEAAVRARRPDGFGGSLAPDFLRWLAGDGGWIGVIDATLVARGRGGGTLPERTDAAGHPRIRLATALRRQVRVYGDERGLVILAEVWRARRDRARGSASIERQLRTGRLTLLQPARKS